MIDLLLANWLLISAPSAGPGERVPVVPAIAETARVSSEGDAADDPAVWFNAAAPERSLIIGTNKQTGLIVYSLQGEVVQTLADGRMNNVDVVRARTLSGEVDLVFASNRTTDRVAGYAIDPSSGQLSPLTPGGFDPALTEVYGLCAYADPRDHLARVVVNSKNGTLKILRVFQAETGWQSVVERTVLVGSQIEGCVVDVRRGWLYVGEEDVGLWRYPLDSASEAPRALVDTVVGEIGPHRAGHLTADVEGVTLFRRGDEEGWLIVSSQGNNRFAVYNAVSGAYAGSFAVALSASGTTDHVTNTDGVSACAEALGPRFPQGVLVVQDDNEGSRQNFKTVDWREIDAALGLSKQPR